MSARRRRSAAATAAVLTTTIALLGGCAGKDEPVPQAGASATTPATSGTDGTTASEVPGAELVGRWAHYDIVAYEDAVMKTMIISYGFTDFTVEGGRLIEAEQFCSADQVSDQPIKTNISDAATQAIKPVPTPVEVSGEPGAWRVRRPGTPTAVGIRLADPANEVLPTDRNDPRIVDHDGDGNPGITVTVRIGDGFEGELYIARREIFAYDMTQVGTDELKGTVTDSSEQLVIGASLDLLDVPTQWDQVADPTLSPILLRRVGDDWDCDRLMAERNELLPPDPSITW